MATIIENQDGTYMMTCTPSESDTLAGLPDGQLAAYVTIWIEGQAGHVLHQRLSRLTTQEKESVMTTLKSVDVVRGGR